MTSIFFVQCIIKQLLDSVCAISRIIKVSVQVRLITEIGEEVKVTACLAMGGEGSGLVLVLI